MKGNIFFVSGQLVFCLFQEGLNTLFEDSPANLRKQQPCFGEKKMIGFESSGLVAKKVFSEMTSGVW